MPVPNKVSRGKSVWVVAGDSDPNRDQVINSVTFSLDGRRIVSGSYDRTDTDSITLTVAFLPDGKHIMSGSFDHTIRLWDVELGNPCADTLRQLIPLRSPPTEGGLCLVRSMSVGSVAFSPEWKVHCIKSIRRCDPALRCGKRHPRQVGNPFHVNSCSAFSLDEKLVPDCLDDASRIRDVATTLLPPTTMPSRFDFGT